MEGSSPSNIIEELALRLGKVPARLAGAPGGIRAAAAVLGFAALAALIFVCRAPILVASDVPFEQIYGRNRILARQISLSLRFFRPVRMVRLAEEAAPDAAALAMELAAAAPRAVFFPYRWAEGAERYARAHPETPTAVLAGRESRENSINRVFPAGSRSSADGLVWLVTDTEWDLYLAGRCAALLAAQPAPAGSPPAEEAPAAPAVLYLGEEYSGAAGASLRRAFSQGLEDQGGGAGAPEEKICVLAGGGDTYFMEGAAGPLILFSWVDPALVPRNTAVVFDDSPWAVLPRALKFLEKAPKGESGAGEGKIPSEIRILVRGPLKRQLGMIKRLNIGAEAADN